MSATQPYLPASLTVLPLVLQLGCHVSMTNLRASLHTTLTTIPFHWCRVAKAAAAQRALADTEVALAARAAALAEEAAAAIAQTDRATSLVATALPRLRHASTTAVSVARLQLECAGLTSQQGGELTAMHAALGAVSSLAADIQVRLQAAEQHTRAGHAAKAAAARGQAAAAQEAMQRELRDAHARRERLGQLQSQLLESMRQIQRVGNDRSAFAFTANRMRIMVGSMANSCCTLALGPVQRNTSRWAVLVVARCAG